MVHSRPAATRFAFLIPALTALFVPAASGYASERPAKADVLLALSELQPFEAVEETEFPQGGIDPDRRSPAPNDPESELPAADPDAVEKPDASGPEGAGAEDDAAGKEAVPIPAVLYDTELLPVPVNRMRELIIEAAMTGDIEALRPLIGLGPNQTRLATTRIEEDPIDYLRGTSGDGEGVELMAILLDVLDAGFVKVERPADQGGPYYLWPYFSAMPIEELTAPQEVELLRIVTAGDYDEMKIYGGYNFYRAAITEEGAWEFFLAGH